MTIARHCEVEGTCVIIACCVVVAPALIYAAWDSEGRNRVLASTTQDPPTEPRSNAVERYGGPASFNLLELVMEESSIESRGIVEGALIGYADERAALLVSIEGRVTDLSLRESTLILDEHTRAENRANIARIAWELDALNRRWVESIKGVLDENTANAVQRLCWHESYPDMFERSPLEIVLKWLEEEGWSVDNVADAAIEYRVSATVANDRLGAALDRRFTVEAEVGLLIGDQRVRDQLIGLDDAIDRALLERRNVEKQACERVRIEIVKHGRMPDDIALLLSW